ncbi:fimbrial chaperone [Citrobacter sp. ku-bf4]|nr:fimbrial chaperone [Citrobacter sp. ku-bf4]MBS0824374.1 fimbria/pilus periplasmic chaperone [Citrobacter amalonaticus]
MSPRHRTFISGCLYLFLATCCSHVNASITMTGTRIIYNGAAKSTDVHLKNKDAIPYVVQSWFDNGNMADGPEKSAQVPFIATPPAFRIQSGEGQIIRIVYTQGKELPQDRESLVYFNFMQIPPTNAGQSASQTEKQNSLLIMLRNRVKLFYRPAGLVGDPQKMLENLQVKRISGNKELTISIKNNQPYFVTVAALRPDGSSHIQHPKNDMISPFASETFHFPRTADAQRVRITLINDQGARISADYPL